MHKPQHELAGELELAAQEVSVGAVYNHYKNTEVTYRVLHLAVMEADDSICVVYQAQYGKHLIFVRPLSSWLSAAELEGRMVARFALWNA